MKTILQRSAYSLAGNIIRALLGFATITLLANALGLTEYGKYQLLVSNAASLLYLIDLQTSRANFTFHNQKQQPKTIDVILYYWYGFQLTAFIVLLTFTPWLTWYFQVESKEYIFIAFLAAYAQYRLFALSAQRAETFRLSLHTQLFTLFAVVGIFTALYILSLTRAVNIHVIFITQITFWLISSGLLFSTVRRKLAYTPSDTDVKDALIRYRNFVTPLIAITVLGIFGETADRIMLQHYNGYEQQGILGIAKQISNFVLLATTSILMVYSREITHFSQNTKGEEIKVISLYFSWFSLVFGGSISIFFFLWGREIFSILFTGGFQQAYASAVIAVFISMFQGLGQLYGTALIAANATKVQSKVSSLMISISLLGTYLTLNPLYINGGAYELLIKQLIVQYIGIQVTSYFLRKHIGYAISPIEQLLGLLLLYLPCLGLKLLTSAMPLNATFSILLNGIAYFMAIFAISFRLYKRLKCLRS